MRKILLLSLLGFISFTMNAQTKSELEAKIADLTGKVGTLQGDLDKAKAALELINTEGWKRGGVGNLNVGAASFNNWVQGGQDAVTIGATVNPFMNYRHNRIFWSNIGIFQLGYLGQKATDGDFGFNKNLDELLIKSEFNYKINNKIYSSTSLDFDSQFLKTKDPNYDSINGSIDYVSKFFNPAIITFGTGISYIPKDWIKVSFKPLAIRSTIYTEEALAQNNLGFKDTIGNKTKFSSTTFGALASVGINKEVYKGITYGSVLDVFLDYNALGGSERILRKPSDGGTSAYNVIKSEGFSNALDVNWINTLGFKISKYLSANVDFALRRFPRTESKDWQRRFGFGAGLGYQF